MVQASKQNQVIYTSLAEPMFSIGTEDADNISYSFIMSVVSMSLAVLLSIGLAALFKKYRELSILIAAAKAPSQAVANAINLPAFHYTRPTLATTTTQPSSIDLSTIDTSSIILFVALLTVVIIYKLVKLCTKSFRRNALIVEVTNGKDNMNFPIATLPVCIENIYITGTDFLKTVKVSEAWFPELSFDLGDLCVVNKYSGNNLNLSSTTRLSPIHAYGLRNIIKGNTFEMFLWIRQGPYKVNPNITPRAKSLTTTETKSALYPVLSEEQPFISQ